MKATIAVLLALAAIGALGYFGIGRSMQRRVLYPRPAPPGSSPRLPTHAQVAWLGPKSQTEAWYLPSMRSRDPSPVLVFAHGNGELIDDWVSAFDPPREWGMGVLLVEYPGYGRSGGAPSQRSITEAFVAAYDFAVGLSGVDPAHVVGYGRSLGGGAIGALAGRRDLSALIFESSFTSVRELASRFGMPRHLVADPFDNLAALSRFDGPVLVIHGALDEMIPVEHGRALAQASGSELQLLSCGHNDCPRPWSQIRGFLERESILIPPAQ